ncbi:MAG: hypothetical protein NT062_06990 [Proteobacteria bacterium]|nr:hypothetical protein [Pseudomonadota bacterium]
MTTIGIEVTWPVDFAVSGRNREAHRACAMSPNMMAFQSASPYAPGWLNELTLHLGDETLVLLATIQTCEPSRGGWLVTAQPFALAGEPKMIWLRFITQTRAASRKIK